MIGHAVPSHPADRVTMALRHVLAGVCDESAAADFLFLERWEVHPLAGAAAARRVHQIRRENTKGRHQFPGDGQSKRLLELSQLEIGRGCLAALHNDLIGHLLPVVQALQTSGLNGGNVHENILAAVLRHNEAEALGGVEPFNGTGRHGKHTP